MLREQEAREALVMRSRERVAVVLVVGPRIPEALMRRHCRAALDAGHTVALVQLRPVAVGERYLLRALARWYGESRIAVIENHEDWRAVPDRRRLIVLSDRGLWRDDEHAADRDEMLAMSSQAISALY